MLTFHPRLLIAAVFFVFTFGISVSASVLTVTTIADTDDAVCDSQCSLREAISTAADGDTIIFARDIRGGTIQLTRTLAPAVGKFVKVDGPNRRRITLQGNNTFRIIESHGNLWIDGLIIRDGNAGDGDGGGILATGVLNLTNIGIVNNSAQHGGGIFITGGTLIIADSLIAGNTASGDGSGGGVDAYNQSRVWINNSTLSGNRSLSTVDGAGGLRLYNPASCPIVSSTIAFNTSNGTSVTSAGGIATLGIGIGPVVNTILAKNGGVNNPDHYKGFGAINSLIGITYPASGIINGVNGNIVGSASAPVEPVLAPLFDNGGLQTHALEAGSPAIDSGNNERADDRRGNPLLVDQRGFVRLANAVVDMGAYESASQQLVTFSTVQGQAVNATGRGIAGARVELRDAGGEVRYAVTNPFGYFHFANVSTDQTYTINCIDKRNVFPSQIVLVEEGTEYINFIAAPF